MMPEALPTRCIRMTYIIVVALQMLLNYPLHADGLKWIKKPNANTSGQKGRNISMTWQYKMEKNEEFLSSTCYKIEPYNRLAFKRPGDDHYFPFKGKIPPYMYISTSGAYDVTLTVQDAELSYSGEYCCEVTFKSNNKNRQNQTCTNLFVYEPTSPAIQAHRSTLSTLTSADPSTIGGEGNVSKTTEPPHTEEPTVMTTKLNSSSPPEDLEKTDKLSSILILLGITLSLFVIIVICYWKKIKKQQTKDVEAALQYEDQINGVLPRQEEPLVDAVDTSRSSDKEQADEEGKTLIDDDEAPQLCYQEKNEQELIERFGLDDGHPGQV